MQSDEAPPASGDDVAPRADAPDWTMWGILAGALVLRVAAILAFPSIHHPDEDFQIFEQAHRWAFGYGIVPWEFVVGIRSPVLPLIFAAVFKLAAPVVGGPQGYLLVARLLLALSSLAAVAAVYRMGRRTSMTHALIGALVAATWFEIVYFADRPLTGAVATTVLLVVLSLASVPGGAFTPRRLVAIGFSLGLCLMLRVQLAPGLFIVALWVGRLHMRQRWLPMALGGLVPIAVFALADWAVWGGFFHSYFAAVQVNLVENVASRFGTAPVGAYARWLLEQWRFAFPLLWLLIAVRARGSAVWILTAIAIIAVHSAIPHKEYRFVYPAFACLIIVAAMGSADLLQKARARLAAAVLSRARRRRGARLGGGLCGARLCLALRAQLVQAARADRSRPSRWPRRPRSAASCSTIIAGSRPAATPICTATSRSTRSTTATCRGSSSPMMRASTPSCSCAPRLRISAVDSRSRTVSRCPVRRMSASCGAPASAGRRWR